MSCITREDNGFDFTLGSDGQLTRYVEGEGAGIKFTILSRLNPADDPEVDQEGWLKGPRRPQPAEGP